MLYDCGDPVTNPTEEGIRRHEENCIRCERLHASPEEITSREPLRVKFSIHVTLEEAEQAYKAEHSEPTSEQTSDSNESEHTEG